MIDVDVLHRIFTTAPCSKPYRAGRWVTDGVLAVRRFEEEEGSTGHGQELEEWAAAPADERLCDAQSAGGRDRKDAERILKRIKGESRLEELGRAIGAFARDELGATAEDVDAAIAADEAMRKRIKGE